MAVTLKYPYLTTYDNNIFKNENGVYVLTEDFKVILSLEIDTRAHAYEMSFKKGFKCDGLSVPFVFRWFLPKWDKKNLIYNVAGVVHDALYGNRGFSVFSREECDDVFRGIMRESGISRFKAGCADKAVGMFADSHFGNDDYKCKDLVKLDLLW